MNYLLIGSNGFLSKKFQLFLKKKNKKFKLISSKNYDLTSKSKSKKLKNIKGEFKVIFFSALTPDKGKGLKTFYKNSDMMRNFIQNFNIKSINHFTYISSDAVYSQKDIKVNESTNPSPDDLYGMMHLSREYIIKDFLDPLNLTILRPTLIYGNGDTHNSYGPNRFIKQLINNQPINIFGKGLDQRDHISVQDVCNAIFLTSENKSSGIFNVVTGKSNTFKKIANLVIKYHNKKASINFIKNNNKPSIRKYDPKKILNVIGKVIDIDTGIKKYYLSNKS